MDLLKNKFKNIDINKSEYLLRNIKKDISNLKDHLDLNYKCDHDDLFIEIIDDFDVDDCLLNQIFKGLKAIRFIQKSTKYDKITINKIFECNLLFCDLLNDHRLKYNDHEKLSLISQIKSNYKDNDKALKIVNKVEIDVLKIQKDITKLFNLIYININEDIHNMIKKQ